MSNELEAQVTVATLAKVLGEHEYECDVLVGGTVRPACKCGWAADHDWSSVEVYDDHVARAILASDWLDAVRQKAGDERAEEIAQAIDEMRTFAHGNNPISEAHVLGYGTARRLAARIARESR